MDSNIGVFACYMGADPGSPETFFADHFLEHLFLFDVVHLDSARLKEVQPLVELLGLKALLGLLRSKKVLLYCDLYTHINYMPMRKKPEELMISNEFEMSVIVPHDRKDYISHCLESLDPLRMSLGKKTYQALKYEVAQHAQELPKDRGDAGPTKQVHSDLAEHPRLIRQAIVDACKAELPTTTHARLENLEIEVTKETTDRYVVRTNLVDAIKAPIAIPDYKLVEKGLLRLASIEQALHMRRALKASVQLRPEDGDLLELKYDDLVKKVTPDAAVERFQKILRLKGLPTFTEAFKAGALNIDKLMAMRDSDEAIAFRQFLFSSDGQDIEALVAKSNTLLTALANKFNLPWVRTAVFALSNLPAIGQTIGALDFLGGFGLKKDSVLWCLDHQLPRLFSSNASQLNVELAELK